MIRSCANQLTKLDEAALTSRMKANLAKYEAQTGKKGFLQVEVKNGFYNDLPPQDQPRRAFEAPAVLNSQTFQPGKSGADSTASKKQKAQQPQPKPQAAAAVPPPTPQDDGKPWVDAAGRTLRGRKRPADTQVTGESSKQTPKAPKGVPDPNNYLRDPSPIRDAYKPGDKTTKSSTPAIPPPSDAQARARQPPRPKDTEEYKQWLAKTGGEWRPPPPPPPLPKPPLPKIEPKKGGDPPGPTKITGKEGTSKEAPAAIRVSKVDSSSKVAIRPKPVAKAPAPKKPIGKKSG